MPIRRYGHVEPTPAREILDRDAYRIGRYTGLQDEDTGRISPNNDSPPIHLLWVPHWAEKEKIGGGTSDKHRRSIGRGDAYDASCPAVSCIYAFAFSFFASLSRFPRYHLASDRIVNPIFISKSTLFFKYFYRFIFHRYTPAKS